MPEIRPFDAWQYQTGAGKAGTWETLCCPPYDVVPEQRQLELEALNPYNCIQLERPLGDNPYEQAAGLLSRWRSEGILARAGTEAYFVYELGFESGGQTYTLRGFTGRCALSPFSEGEVLPHEETLSKAKADRMALMQATKCNFSAIYALYRDPEHTVPELLGRAVKDRQPDADFILDGVTHRLWRVTDKPVIDGIGGFFAQKQVFIADGHHRYETAVAYRDLLRQRGGLTPGHPANYVMMSLFDMENPGLVVLPTHRVVFGVDPQAVSNLVSAVDADCCVEDCKPCDIPERLAQAPGSIAFYHSKSAYLITPRDKSVMKRLLPGECDAYRELDVAVLHTLLLEPRFGIDKQAMARQQNLIYTRDWREALELVDSGRGQCAFLLSPTKVSQIRDVSLEGGKMPQKSTYFYPKLITGLYINGLE